MALLAMTLMSVPITQMVVLRIALIQREAMFVPAALATVWLVMDIGVWVSKSYTNSWLSSKNVIFFQTLMNV